MDQRTFEQNVRDLAEKLKKTGIAVSDAQANMMATSILQTERKSSQNFERKKDDPNVNPQLRTVQTPTSTAEILAQPPIVSGPVGTLAGISSDTKLSDLDKPKMPEPASAVVPERVAQEAFQEQTTETVAQRETNDVSNTAEFGQDLNMQVTQSEPAKKVDVPSEQRMPQAPINNQQQPQETMQPQQQTTQADVKPSVQEAQKEEPKRPQQPKIDLSEMFNFSKKR